jgi:hypothetical protein
MEGREPLWLRATDGFDLSESIEHSQIDVVRVGLGNLADSLVVIDDFPGNLETLQDDWRPDTSGI